MFIPEPGEEFHVYTEGGGLFKNTIFRCAETNAKAVQAEYVAGIKPSYNGLAWFYRDKCSFWPVQPGYREHLRGEKFAMGKVLDQALVKADPDFQKFFSNFKKPPVRNENA
jgi:hypothetical protein